MGGALDGQKDQRLYHLVYTLGISAVFGLVDVLFLWPESHLKALLAGAAVLSLIATYELKSRGAPWRLVAAVAAFLFVLAIVASWCVGPPVTALKPLIDVRPRSLANLMPGEESGVGMTFRSAETSPATAYDVRTNVQVFAAPFPLPENYPMPEKPKVFESSGSLAPGGEIAGFGHTTEPLTAAQVAAIEDGSKMRLYVAGTLSYRLASGQDCDIEFLWETGGADLMVAYRAFESDHKTKPPWWEGDRFNDITPACR